MPNKNILPPTHPPPLPNSERHNARLGLFLFFFYLAIYAAYVIINAFWPTLMDRIPFGGLNLAVWYGMGLIIGAFLLALLYAWLCQLPAKDRP